MEDGNARKAREQHARVTLDRTPGSSAADAETLTTTFGPTRAQQAWSVGAVVGVHALLGWLLAQGLDRPPTP